MILLWRDDPEDSGEQSSATRPVVSQSTANKILRQIKKMEKSLKGEIQRVSKRVERLEENHPRGEWQSHGQHLGQIELYSILTEVFTECSLAY